MGAQRAVLSDAALAREFTEADLSPVFRSNGTSMPDGEAYAAFVADAFASWRLEVGGLVERPAVAVARRPQGAALAHPDHPPRLRRGLERDRQVDGRAARADRCRAPALKPNARYVVFHCADDLESLLRRQWALLREHRPRRRLPPPDHPRLCPQRRRPAGRERRAAAPAGGAPARLQAGQVHHAHRGGGELRRDRPGQGRLLGRPRLRMVRRHMNPSLRHRIVTMSSTSRFRHGLLAAALLSPLAALAPARAAEEPVTVPPPAMDEKASGARETAVLAGGCFWGVQGVFQHVKGVSNAVSGYAGGRAAEARYEAVSTGSTGHAEAVQVTFDPRQISYGRILQIYFSVAHDPTQLDRQGPDTGTQYRSAVFPTSSRQSEVAKAYIAQLDKAQAFKAAIVTRVEDAVAFHPAEAYHQDFLVRNPTYPYIVINDLPKVDALKRLFPDVYRAKPALVASASQ